jgi:hypothetical protein
MPELDYSQYPRNSDNTGNIRVKLLYSSFIYVSELWFYSPQFANQVKLENMFRK